MDGHIFYINRNFFSGTVQDLSTYVTGNEGTGWLCSALYFSNFPFVPLNILKSQSDIRFTLELHNSSVRGILFCLLKLQTKGRIDPVVPDK